MRTWVQVVWEAPLRNTERGEEVRQGREGTAAVLMTGTP